MRSGVILLLLAGTAVSGAPRVDNVLVAMVPPGSTALVGAHMDSIKMTEAYRKLLAARELDQMDQFARETGFDPRRDVRELLFVSTPHGGVLLARGTFRLAPASFQDATRIRHREYDIWSRGDSGFCILDSTLAAAGRVETIESALDEWKSGSHTAAQPFLARASLVDPQSHAWGISNGLDNVMPEQLPGAGAGLDLSKIFRGLRDTWFEVNLSGGFRADVHGTAASEKDAINLRDAVRGMVGLGRLNVPEKQEDLLRVWDGITVEQQGRSIRIEANIPQDLIDRMIQLLGTGNVQRRIL